MLTARSIRRRVFARPVVAAVLLALSSTSAWPWWARPCINPWAEATPVVSGGRQVVEGEEVSRRVVAILAKRDGKRQLCGGVLISRVKVLTAGHCLAGATSATIYFGIDVEAPVTSVEAVELRVHPKYRDGPDDNVPVYDLGVAVLAKQAPADFIVTRDYVIGFKKGAQALLAGYGERDCRVPATGRSKGLLFDTVVTAAFTYGYEFVMREEKGGTCGGDSGSPVFAKVKGKFALVGVHTATLPPQEGEAFSSGRGVRLGSPEIEAWFLQERDSN